MSRRALGEDLGKLVLRVTVAGLMLFHGVAKLQHGVGGIGRALAAKGLPHFISYGVYVGEVVAPLFVLAGFATRPAAAVIAFNMVVAVLMQHTGDVGGISRTGGWKVELQALYFFGAVAVALLGAGRLSASRGRGRLD